ncbi:carboxypeptidase-like regulatory domain-containing protein [Dyadobacter psychrotolerans]|uniref:Carboxypeptidase regulatory-like domain-containing protein n=1 Tax=Dyadobacter psychrotolerans TaxID=2541721 RepID=A0A4R5DL51_9BACT|nr:carboxypeptidase-like regulatory domain-containing protein [Dyadobacter psychrotolerans]TDE11585.1 carboxypeptidase regulatory-like domain-containing protein [Dyadobacter psychrotolerans]
MLYKNRYTRQTLIKFVLIIPAICLFVTLSSGNPTKTEVNYETFLIENISIEGIVRDEEGKLIKDATVSIKGTRNSTTTGEKGTFKLTDVAIGSTLTVAHSSYESYTIEVTGVTTLDVIVLQKRSSTN